jgi:hypothetical protein
VTAPAKRIVATLVALVLAELGCKPVCDEAGLRRAAELFEARSPERRSEGLEALGEACPTMPSSLGRSLAAQSLETSADPAWRELLAETCPRSPEEHDQASAEEDRDRATRSSCKLDRYGLLAPDDAFIERDLAVLVLYQWLVSGRVSRAVATDVVWPLLSASASAEELEAMCLREGHGCARVLASWGVALPRSNVDEPTRGGTEILITSSQLSVDRTPLLALTAGRPAPGVFVRHVAPSLRDTLVTIAEAEHGPADDGLHGRGHVTLVADRATPFDTFADVLFTATKAGFTEADLVVYDGRELHGLPLHLPAAWLPPRQVDIRAAATIGLTFAVHRDAVETRATDVEPQLFPNPAACEPSPSGCHDLEAIAAFAEQLQQRFPYQAVATFRVDGDVSLQALVSLVDAVRGQACHLRDTQTIYMPPECWFFLPVVDAEPPLYFHADRPDTLVLGEATVEARSRRSVPDPTERALLTAYAAGRDEIARCFEARPDVTRSLADRVRFSVMVGRAKDDARRTTARVFLDGFIEDELERCILAPLGVEPDRRPSSTDFLGTIRAELRVSTRFE